MLSKPPEPGMIYRHTRTRDKYYVRCLGEMKWKDGKWTPSVNYEGLLPNGELDPSKPFCTRELERFMQNFDEVVIDPARPEADIWVKVEVFLGEAPTTPEEIKDSPMMTYYLTKPEWEDFRKMMPDTAGILEASSEAKRPLRLAS